MIITKYECFLEWRNDFKIINQVSSLMLLCVVWGSILYVWWGDAGDSDDVPRRNANDMMESSGI